LLDVAFTSREPPQDYEPPRTETEIELARVWERVLGVARVGVRDNFFELGGDSILSIQIVAGARSVGFEITPRDVFEHPTIAELGLSMSRAVEPFSERPSEASSRLTPIQRWFFEQRVPLHHYNQAVLVDLTRKLDDSILETALRHVLASHAA